MIGPILVAQARHQLRAIPELTLGQVLKGRLHVYLSAFPPALV